MQSVTLKNIPDDVHASLKELARLHRRSLNSEILLCLEKYAGHSPADTQQILDKARRGRTQIEHSFSASEIKDAIDAGRK